MHVGTRLAALTGSLAANWGYGALLATAFLVPVPHDYFSVCACSIFVPEPMTHAYIESVSPLGDRPVKQFPVAFDETGGVDNVVGNHCPAGPTTDRQARLLTDVALPASEARNQDWPDGTHRLCVLVNPQGHIEQAFAVRPDWSDPHLLAFIHKVRREWRFDPPTYQGRTARTWQRLVIVGPADLADRI